MQCGVHARASKIKRTFKLPSILPEILDLKAVEK